MKKIIISLFGCIFLFSSCSTVKFFNDSTLKTETGIKVYSAKPYLINLFVYYIIFGMTEPACGR